MKRSHLFQAYTLVEILITLAIGLILVAIAVPSYQNYMRHGYYREIVEATIPYKNAVSECAQNLGSIIGCDAGTNNIPAAITMPTGAVESLTVISGVISAKPVASRGVLETDTYILTPELAKNGVVTWEVSGEAVKHGYVE